jgi:hypothetical protein
MIKDGHFGATALHGLRVAIAGRWDNAEPPKAGFPAIRPPWHVILYVDDRANPEQRLQIPMMTTTIGRTEGTEELSKPHTVGCLCWKKAARAL